jgi:Fic family protein
MIKTGRKPVDRSEQMILNNFETMQFINTLKDTELTKDLIFEIHQKVTHDTLDDPSSAGRFRTTDEDVRVIDQYNEIMHTPPHADSLDGRLELLCEFANGQLETGYIHPVIRSIILHFWMACDHPFVDGNGRTARALFYWSMLRHKYWLFEFVSISQIILNAPAKYERAFLYTETDENDLTYFILYHLDVIHRAIEKLHEYIQRKTQRLQTLERDLKGLATLNHRQRMLMGHALRHPHQKYTFRSHQTSHGIVYQTSRLDLMDLEQKGLLKSSKVGRTWYFTPAKNLEAKLAKLT